MKLAASLAAVLLAGCSSIGSISHGSWLDVYGKRPSPPLVMSDEQASFLQQEAAQLRSQSDALRARLAGEADRSQRIRRYAELRALGERLAPIERSLRDAGRPVKAAGAPSPAA